MVNSFRKALIRIGKVLPFVICMLICTNYAETCLSVYTNDFVLYDNAVIPNTKLSFFIGQYFEYNIQMLVVITIISISIQTCIYNKIACAYMGVNLIEKSYFHSVELFPEYIYTICFTNIAVCVWLCWNGLIRILKLSDAISWFRWITYKVIQK